MTFLTSPILLDTVKFRPLWSRLLGTCPQSWREKIHRSPLPVHDLPNSEKQVCAERSTFTHLPSGMRVHGDRLAVHWVECSLPRVLFGCNGQLIKSQIELDNALAAADAILAEVATQMAWRDFLRADLCWQFALPPSEVIQLHANCRHPSIRRAPMNQPGEFAKWGSKSGRLRVVMYDKFMELFGRPGDTLRVEVIMLREKLRMELTGKDEPVRHLDFDACYRAFRRVLLGFTPTAQEWGERSKPDRRIARHVRFPRPSREWSFVFGLVFWRDESPPRFSDSAGCQKRPAVRCEIRLAQFPWRRQAVP